MKSRNVFRSLSLVLLMLMFAVKTSHGQVLLFGAKEKGKKYGYINERGDYVIAPAFDDAGFFNKGAAVVKQGKKFGIINEQGQFTVQPIYDGANYYAPEAKFTMKKGTKWGVVNAKGEEIVPFEHDFLSVMKDGYVVAGKFIPGKLYKGRVCPTVLNEKNEIIFSTGENDPEQHDCTQLFLPGLVDAATGSYSMGWPIVRENMLVVAEAWEGGPKYFQHKIMDVRTGVGTVLSYELKISDNYLGMREGLLAVDRAQLDDEQRQNDWPGGSINLIGANTPWTGIFLDTTLIKSELYDVLQETQGVFTDLNAQHVHPFFNNVASVEINDKWVFVDHDGWTISETKLSTSEYKAYPPMYFNGLIGFFKNGKAGYVDINGKEVIPFDLQEYHPFEFNVTPVKKGGLFGLLRKDGSWAVAPKFEQLFLSPCPCYQ